MSRVLFTHKGGRQERMELRYAKILQGLKRGTYMTRDMLAEPVSTDALDSMSAKELRELAKDRDVKVHHKAGPDKIREALREADVELYE